MFKFTLLLGMLMLFVLPAFAQNESSNDSPKDRKLKITTGIRVVVPDEAKRNINKWTVRLEIIFQADGTIGEVRCINDDNEETRKLIKYGIVQAYIDGAKKIEFEPEIRDGSPKTVLKKHEYTYSIY